MTTTWGMSYLYGSVSRVAFTSARNYAICPLLRRVLVTARRVNGGVIYHGQTSRLAFQPLEIAIGAAHFYVIGTTGIEKHTLAATPVFANLFSFDAGLGSFVFVQSSYLVVPDGESGVKTISATTGATQASLPGVLGRIHAACYDSVNRRLWLFDQERAKGVSIQVGTAGQLTYVSSFVIPHCRNIVRVVFDSTAELFFVVNDHRIVSFSTMEWGTPTVSRDYGVSPWTYTDFAVVGEDQYWIGMKEPSSTGIPGDFGRQYGAWDFDFSEMNIVCPQMSLWTVNAPFPYWNSAHFPPYAPYLYGQGPEDGGPSLDFSLASNGMYLPS